MSAKTALQESESLQKKQSQATAPVAHESANPTEGWQRLTPRSVLQLQRTVGNRAVIQFLQRRAEEEQRSATGAVARGGMPENLRAGVESLSGMDMSSVQVHRNSSDAHRVGALAYAQGNDIHLAPGQEQHLPHEAWHVVQQRQGRVQPTGTVADGRSLNDDPALESEADHMGAKALQMGAVQRVSEEDEPMQAKGNLQRVEEEEPMQAKGTLQRVEDEEEPMQGKGEIQRVSEEEEEGQSEG